MCGLAFCTMQILLSPEDQHLLAEYRWFVMNHGYVCRYETVGQKRRIVLLHRTVSGEPDGLCVDHINGNKLDNRRENLRACTHAENMRNRAMHKSNKAGVKGVYFDARRGLYRAQIRSHGVKHSLGYFGAPGDAAAAYAKAASQMHGEFARLG